MIIPGDDQIFAHSAAVNTTISGSASALEESHWYTMQDITDTVRPYKVFTALLTQSGGDDVLELSGGDDFQIGVTYLILDNPDNQDLTVFGAPNSNVGTYFICTNLGINLALLQYNTGAPVVNVLENTIGNVWFTYANVGTYRINSDELFVDKTFMDLSNVTNINNNDSGSAFIGVGLLENSSFLTIQSVGVTDGDMYNTPIEIRVYN